MSEFPGAVPTNRQSSTADYLSNMSSGFGHVALHNFHNNEIIALATKLGTGASTPSAGNILRGTGVGTSAWGQIVPSTDLAAFSSSDLRGLLTDETGTGAAVFGTAPSFSNPAITGGGSWTGSPSLTTPTIADFSNATHAHQNTAGGGTLNGASAIQDGTITPAELQTGTGATWDWATWVPTLAASGGGSPTLGNGVVVARYVQTGKTVNAMFSLTLGTTTSFGTGTLLVSLPVSRATWSANLIPLGLARIKDVSTGDNYVAFTELDGSNSRVDFTLHDAGTNGKLAAFISGSGAVPMAWATGDILEFNICYEAA